MARKQLKNYVFTPGGAGVGTVKLPGNYELADILTILNATDQVFIYNFADPGLGGSASWTSAYDNDFPQSQDGVTTLTLTSSTSSMDAGDSLAIYIETGEQIIRPWEFGTDAVERTRVAPPQSLIDADFEYGLQNTKWQSLFLNNDIPSLYELPGSEISANTAGYVTFLGTGTVSNNSDTSITLCNQSGTFNVPNWTANDYALVVNPYVANPPPTTYVTANAAIGNQRTITVDSTTGFSVGDQLVVAYTPLTNQTTVSTTISSGATTSLVLTSASGIAAGTMLMVQTNTTNVWELMFVSSVLVNTATVVRRRMNSN